MALITLAPGAETSRCPSCGGPMTEPIRGRHTLQWFRHCHNLERCNTTTATADVPTGVPDPEPLTTPAPRARQASLPRAPA